jgi:hypothetical protein
MDRNYCLIVFIKKKEKKGEQHRVLTTSTCDIDVKKKRA